MELLIAQNSLSQDAIIDLMDTFGGARTTFEHFGSNKRKDMESELRTLMNV